MQEEVTLSPTAKRNVATIADVEQKLLHRRPSLERFGETISHFFGSVRFIAAHTALIGMWILWNVSRHRGAVSFDTSQLAGFSKRDDLQYRPEPRPQNIGFLRLRRGGFSA